MKKARKNAVKRLVSVVLGITMCAGVFSGTVISHAADNEVKTIDMYLVAGQSNAAGTSEMADVSGYFENVWYAGETNRQVNGNYSNSWLDKDEWKKGVTTGYGAGYNWIGPELGMASVLNDMYAGTDTKAMIFKTAIGSTKLVHETSAPAISTYGSWVSSSQWEEGYKPVWNANGTLDSQYLKGALYQLFLNNFTTVYEQLIADGYTVNIKGFVWQQGESDIHAASEYEPLFRAFIQDIRKDLGIITNSDLSYMPIVFGEISRTFDGPSYPEKGYVNPYADSFIEMQKRVAKDMPHVKMVESSDFLLCTSEGKNYGVDPWHYSGQDMLELGKRFGSALVNMNSIQLNDFTMLGASVRVKTEETDNTGDGIRFAVGIKKSVWETMKDKEIHILLMPEQLVTGELEKGETFSNGTSNSVAIDTVVKSEWKETTVCGVEYMKGYTYLYGIPDSFYDITITGRAYYEEDASIVYTEEVTRSFAYVADAAIKDESWTGDKTSLDKYLPTYTVTFTKDGETKETQQVKYGQKAIKPTDAWISDSGFVVDRWLDNGEIWHFNRPVCEDLVLTPLMMIGEDHEMFEVGSGGYKLSEDASTVTALRGGRLLFKEDKVAIPKKLEGADSNYTITFSMKTPADTNLTGTADHTDGRDKGIVFGYDEADGSHWMFAFRYRNPGSNGSQEGFYPYLRKQNSNGILPIVRGMDSYTAFEVGKWYDYRIHVTAQDDATTIMVQYKESGTDTWKNLISSYKFEGYTASGTGVGFLMTGPMECNTNVTVTVPDEGDYGFSWKDDWSDALDSIK